MNEEEEEEFDEENEEQIEKLKQEKLNIYGNQILGFFCTKTFDFQFNFEFSEILNQFNSNEIIKLKDLQISIFGQNNVIFFFFFEFLIVIKMKTFLTENYVIKIYKNTKKGNSQRKPIK